MRERRLRVDARIDLVPILSLIIHLIPVLLIAARFRELAQLDAEARVIPAVRTEDGARLAEQSEQVVSVRIDREGFRVGGGGAEEMRVPCRGACAPETYDRPALTSALAAVKARLPSEDRVVLVVDPAVPYAVVVLAMEAARGEPGGPVLFPKPILVVAAEGAR